MKKVILSAFVAGMVAVSCSKKESVKTENTTTTAVAPAATEQVALVGEYKGTIPCADCSGIETELELDADKTYTIDNKYLGGKTGEFKEEGIYEVSADGEFVTLKEQPTPRVFYITKDAAYLVEKVGDKSMKPEYRLARTK